MNEVIAMKAYMVSTTLAPKPETNPALCPLLSDFWTTSIAIGPIGTEAQTPTRNPFSISNIIAVTVYGIEQFKP